MSKISSLFAKQLDRSLEDFRRRNLRHEPSLEKPADLRDYKQLVDSGLDSLHAVYVWTQNLTSMFAEFVSELRACKDYFNVVGKAEQEYLPQGPPMSPLTGSFFTTWAFYDFRFGKSRETIGTILLDVADRLRLDAVTAAALRNFNKSRMGIYELIGHEGNKTRFRELLTDKELLCQVPVTHRGEVGELWYVRILPPVMDIEGYHIAFTTPYILKGYGPKDWLDFLNRSLLKAKDKEEGLHQFLKYGRGANYWNEFVFLAYCGHTSEAVFLTGIPDIRSSLPHAD